MFHQYLLVKLNILSAMSTMISFQANQTYHIDLSLVAQSPRKSSIVQLHQPEHFSVPPVAQGSSETSALNNLHICMLIHQTSYFSVSSTTLSQTGPPNLNLYAPAIQKNNTSNRSRWCFTSCPKSEWLYLFNAAIFQIPSHHVALVSH